MLHNRGDDTSPIDLASQAFGSGPINSAEQSPMSRRRRAVGPSARRPSPSPGQHTPQVRQPVAVQRQSQSALAEQHRRRLVAGVALLRHGGPVARAGGRGRVRLDLVVPLFAGALAGPLPGAWARCARPACSATCRNSGCRAPSSRRCRRSPSPPPRARRTSGPCSSARRTRIGARTRSRVMRCCAGQFGCSATAITNAPTQYPSSSGAISRPRRHRMSGCAPSSGSAARSGVSV